MTYIQLIEPAGILRIKPAIISISGMSPGSNEYSTTTDHGVSNADFCSGIVPFCERS